MVTESVPARRRRFTITLRVFMLLVLAVGVWMGGLVHKARKQREAVAAIKKLGGSIEYNYSYARSKLANRAIWQVARWIQPLVGDDYFLDVDFVELFPEDLWSDRIVPNKSDDVFVHLGQLTRLETLHLMNTYETTDARLKQVGDLKQLENLVIEDADEVTDSGAAQLAKLKNLKSLEVSESKMTDEGLAHLATLPRLEALTLTGDFFTEAGLDPLKGSTHLKKLSIHMGHQLTDAGMAHLKDMESLEWLNIGESRVTDEGLMLLNGLKKLRVIDVGQTDVTEEGIKRFEAAMPMIRVFQ